MRGVLRLIAARVRRRPGPWLLPVLGIALTIAFAGGVAVEATIARDQTSRVALAELSPLDRAVRIGYTGVVTPGVTARAQSALRDLDTPPPSGVVLLNPVRLDGVLVRPAAIDPLAGWTTSALHTPCRPSGCPMLLAGGNLARRMLAAPGVRISIAGSTRLRSTAPLGYVPSGTGSETPLLLSPDVDGLDRLPGLSGVYRSRGWVSVLDVRGLHDWQLPALERRLQLTQEQLAAASSLFSFDGPSSALAVAHAQAAAAPRRLLLAGGGAIAALLLFLVLAAGGLRSDQAAELARLEIGGARRGQRLGFIAGEATLLCAVATVIGAVLALGAGALLSDGAGLPVGATLGHSLISPAAMASAIAGWVLASALLTFLLVAPVGRVADAAAVAAVAVLAVAVIGGGNQRAAVTLAIVPCCCLAVGVLVLRLGDRLLRAGERAARRGPVLVRLALAGLARSPQLPALVAAFIAVSAGLGGFALVYRATLQRGGADQAAQQVPLDATVAAGADFRTPLQTAPLRTWRGLAGGPVLPVRRTDATLISGGASVTIPALGVPAGALTLFGGWRAGELPVPPRALAARLTAGAPARSPGPSLPAGAVRLAVAVRTDPPLAATLTAELRDPAGDVRAVSLVGGGPARVARGALPPGSWELEAIELGEPAGLQATNGHQTAENPAAATQAKVAVRVGRVTVLDRSGRRLATESLRGWRGVGALSGTAGTAGTAPLSFAESGQPGVLRPRQPSDGTPVPVLADRATALAAGRGGVLALTVDGLPVRARVVAELPRFPTVAATSAGFVVADEARLAGALEAGLPGQGRPDELWIDTPIRGGCEPCSPAGRSTRSKSASRLIARPSCATRRSPAACWAR